MSETRLRILADTPMRSYRPVYPRAYTVVVCPGIPVDVHMTHPYLATPILWLLYNIYILVSLRE